MVEQLLEPLVAEVPVPTDYREVLSRSGLGRTSGEAGRATALGVRLDPCGPRSQAQGTARPPRA
eukprot:6384588-Alexandrium_andersonii.AAC.1